jgi:hypothetical protein
MISRATLALLAAFVVGGMSEASAAQSARRDDFRSMAPESAFAQFGTPSRRSHSTLRSYDAYDSQGNYVGSDPDSLVRQQLQRDPPGRGD